MARGETAAAVEVTSADRKRAVNSLTLALSTDPVARWAWPDRRAFDHGTAYGLEDCLAVALWLAPGIEPDEETVMGLMGESMDDQTLQDVGGVFEQMDELHPTDEHWYLPLIGVDPLAQGRRMGSRLLGHA